jgi:hypothetical protein
MKETIAKNIQYLFEHGNFEHWRVMAHYIGMPQSSLNNIRKESKYNVSLSNIEKIIKAFPGMSANWLILGQGSIYLDGSNSLKINQRKKERIINMFK